jgi:predicted nucleic-acid-binding protein
MRWSMSGMAPKIIDANWILRYLLRDDETLFAKASGVLEKAKTGEEKILILESVLAECIYVLLKIYRVDRISIAEKMRDLFSYKGVVNPDRKDLIEAVHLFGRTNFSIVDCLLLSKSINHGWPLLTFDKDLKNACSKREKSNED